MRNATEARVDEVMTESLETVSTGARVRDAAVRMRDAGVNSLLVPGAETGIITSTDVLEAIAAGRDPDECRVDEITTVPIEWVETDLRIQEAAAMMRNHGIHHLPVRDRSGDYVGMVSSTDLRERFAELSMED